MQVFGTSVRFGVQAGASRVSYPEYLANWKRCEELGYDIAYATDHFASYSPETGATPVFESTTLVSAMASQTSRMRCGLMVAGNTFRNPAILAKIAVTLDHISGGRFELGMGSGHIQFEHEQYNIPYYTRGQRLRMLGEAAQIVRSLLTTGRTSFEGRYYTLKDASCEPKPLQQPLPLLIGAIGEEIAIRNVARSADIWNVYNSPSLQEYEQKLAVLERYCGEGGRDPRDIRKSLHIKPLIGETQAEVEDRSRELTRSRTRGTPEQLAEELLTFVKLGASDFVFMLDPPYDMRSLELLATRIAPYVRDEGRKILAGLLTSEPV